MAFFFSSLIARDNTILPVLSGRLVFLLLIFSRFILDGLTKVLDPFAQGASEVSQLASAKDG